MTAQKSGDAKHSGGHGDHEHYIIPDSIVVKVGVTLFLLTIITVAVAHVDLGAWNLVVAVLVATVKALLVALFFMGLFYDKKENAVIFGTSFVFLGIFFSLTAMDIFFRKDRYTNKATAAEAMAFAGVAVGGGSQLKKPWVTTPELVNKGKALYAAQCTACHGASGQGDGPAAAGFNPKPRNFTQSGGWKNGHKVTGVFRTLKEGVGGMPSFGSLPMDDRWALTHYVLSLGGQPEADTAAEYARISVDPSKDTMGGGGSAEAPTLPIEFAIERVAID